jgi:anthranilate synthase component 2
MKILVIDNYDSFTFNLVYILRQEHLDVTVFRNDKITPQQCLKYDAIILSPGPGLPKDAGNLTSIIASCAGKVPMLGVCLGHQAIAEYMGASLRMLDKVYHGVQSKITLSNNSNKLFENVPQSFQAGRYHSWDINPSDRKSVEVIAMSDDGSIMAIQNLEQKLYGIQFHPESILTPEGDLIIQNFIRICKDLK